MNEHLSNIAGTLDEHLNNIIDTIEERVGNRRRAVGLVIGGIVGSLLVLIGIIAVIPKSPVAPPQPSSTITDEVGNGVSASERSDMLDTQTDSETLVPDEAKTVAELSQNRVVKAQLIEMTDATHMRVKLINGDEVIVRLLNVTPTEACTYQKGTRPFELIMDGRSIWLERDTVTTEADGVWPRYVWAQDPDKITSTDTCALWNASQCQADVGMYRYTAEKGQTRNEVIFLACTKQTMTEDEIEAEAKKKQEELWAERKAEQEKKEQQVRTQAD